MTPQQIAHCIAQPIAPMSPKEIDIRIAELKEQGFEVVVMERINPTKRIYLCPDCGATYEYSPRFCVCGADLL